MNRSIAIPIALLVVLLAIFLWTSHREEAEIAPSELGNFLAIDSGAVNRIEVKKLGSLMKFEKRSDGWYVEDGGKSYKAAAGMVEDIDKISYDLRVGEIISSNPEKRMLFQVDTLTGTQVSFYRDEDFLGALMVGKVGPNYQETYVRKPNSADVYLAQGSLSFLFSRPASSFRDKTLLALTKEQINAVEFRGNETNYTLLNQDSVWSVVPIDGGSFVGGTSEVDRVIRPLTNLKFSEFVENPDSIDADFSNPDFEITVGIKDGTERKLMFVKQKGENKNWYVRTGQSEELFLINDYAVNNIAKKSDELKAKESQ